MVCNDEKANKCISCESALLPDVKAAAPAPASWANTGFTFAAPPPETSKPTFHLRAPAAAPVSATDKPAAGGLGFQFVKSTETTPTAATTTNQLIPPATTAAPLFPVPPERTNTAILSIPLFGNSTAPNGGNLLSTEGPFGENWGSLGGKPQALEGTGECFRIGSSDPKKKYKVVKCTFAAKNGSTVNNKAEAGGGGGFIIGIKKYKVVKRNSSSQL